MTNDQIKEIALANGFKFKEQPSGEMNLNPYVYKFSRELLKAQHERIRIALENLSDAVDNTHDQRVIGYCLDWLQEFIDEITVIENSEADDDQ